MKRKLDTAAFGIIAGLIFPLVFGLLFLHSTWPGSFSWETVSATLSSPNMTIKLLCVAIFPDMCGAFLLNTLEMWNACKGLFAALGLYMLLCCIVLIINFV